MEGGELRRQDRGYVILLEKGFDFYDAPVIGRVRDGDLDISLSGKIPVRFREEAYGDGLIVETSFTNSSGRLG